MGESPDLCSTSKKSFASLSREAPSTAPSAQNLNSSLFFSSFHKGRPSLKIPQTLVDTLSKHFRFALIGKFSHGCPSIERSRQIITKLGLKGSFALGHLDPKHMLIKFQHEGDFNRIWLKEIWFLDCLPMKVFRWNLDFRPDVESLIAPVWISLPNLPLFLFDKQCLLSVGRLISHPLTLDAPTTNLSSPSVARICVEVDLLR